MSEFNINDEELNSLLREDLLNRKGSDPLLDMQAKVVFAKEALVVPPPLKEKALFSKLGVKAVAKFGTGWIFTSLSTIAVVTTTLIVLAMNSGVKEPQQTAQVNNNSSLKAGVKLTNNPVNASRREDSSRGKAVTVTPTVSTVKSVNTLSGIRSMEPVSAQTVAPAENVNAITISETKTATPSLPAAKINETKNPVKIAEPVKATKKGISSCRLWKTKDLCTAPDSIKFPYGIECNSCEYTLGCKEYNSMKPAAVILRVYKKTGFTLEKGFQNIYITRSNGKKLTPLAISVDRFMSNVTKARINFKNVVDVILLFSEAEAGDKVSIEGVVEAVVEE